LREHLGGGLEDVGRPDEDDPQRVSPHALAERSAGPDGETHGGVPLRRRVGAPARVRPAARPAQTLIATLKGRATYVYALANDATWTRASLKQAPPAISVSESGTSAVAVTPLRVLRRHSPFGRLTVPRRTIGNTCSVQWTSPRSLKIRTA